MLIEEETVHGASAPLPVNIARLYPYSEYHGYQKRAQRNAGEIL